MSKRNVERFKKLPESKQDYLKDEIQRYLNDPMYSWKDLAEVFTTVTNHNFTNRSVADTVYALGYPKKSRELVNQSRKLKGIKNREKLDAEYEKQQRSMFQKMYTKEEAISLYNSGMSVTEFQRRTGLSQHYITMILEEYGVSLRTPLRTASEVITELEEKGWNKDKLKEKYHDELLTTKQLTKFINTVLSEEIVPRMTERVIKVLGIGKDKELANQSRRKYSVENDTANSGNNNAPKRIEKRIKDLGFKDRKEMAEYYLSNKKYTHALLAKKFNETSTGDDYIFSEHWMQKNLSPYLPKEPSRLEQSVREHFADLISSDIQFNVRGLLEATQKELDIYIPELNIAFEINGNYWHSDRFAMENHGMTATNYHYQKQQECKQLGIDLYFIWERDWNNNNERVLTEIQKLLEQRVSGSRMLSKLHSPLKNYSQKKRFEKTFSKYIKKRNVLRFGVVIDYLLEGDVYVKFNGFADTPYKTAVNALKENQTLLQFYEWSTDTEIRDVVGGKVFPLKKVSAHSLKLVELDYKTFNSFINQHHSQGSVRRSGNDVFYGLYDEEGVLLAVSSFAKPRFNKSYEYEFIRYAVDKNFIVYGGVEKMFKKFVHDRKPKNIISYLDFNETTRQHTFLNSLGFTERKRTGSRKVWFRRGDKKLIPQGSLMRKGADALLGTVYGSVEKSGLNNLQIMELEGFKLYHTAGNRVFSFDRVLI